VIAATPRLFLPIFLAVTHTAQPAARHRRPLPRLSWNLRLILGITLLLLGLGSLSCQVQNSVGDGPVVTPAGQWVRTVGGWERTEMWHAPELYVPRLHPLVVAAGQGLVSVTALMVCARQRRVGRRCQQR
jgi:di/tricarboxylate transporter